MNRLVLTARRAQRLDELAAELRTIDAAVEVATISEDLAESAAAERVIASVRDHFGRLDLLVNNAGLGLPTLFADADPWQLRQQIAVNFTAPLLLARQALPLLRESRGTIVNIGSAITCVASSALGAYGATKSGLAYWNDALRRELASEGVTVCLVEPGPIKTAFSEAFQARLEEGQRPHPVVNTPSEWMTADVEDVARRIVRLIEHPRRRLSVRRRLVWPFRAMGALFRAWPALGDWVVTRVFGVTQKRKHEHNTVKTPGQAAEIVHKKTEM
jgi:short-subunit dehydrogenase